MAGFLFGLFLLWELGTGAGLFAFLSTAPTRGAVEGTTAAVGELLFTRYALPFEVASLLLLVGIVGAIVLGKKTLIGSDPKGSDPLKR